MGRICVGRAASVVLGLGILISLCSGQAEAATAKVKNGVLTYKAAAGEATNAVDITRSPAGATVYTVKDTAAGVSISGSSGCSGSGSTVTCTASLVTGGLSVDIGNGGGSIHNNTTTGTVSPGCGLIGGNGKDNIFGGSGRDVICGGDNQDFLCGGLGNDDLYGDGGPDFLDFNDGEACPGALGPDGVDYYDGGAGSDYWGGFLARDHHTLVWLDEGGQTIDFAYPLQGGGYADRNSIFNVERMYGSRGDDHLIGNNAANIMYGWYGNDTLEGEGGPDTYKCDQGVSFTAPEDGNADVVDYHGHTESVTVTIDDQFNDGNASDAGTPVEGPSTGRDNVKPDCEVVKGSSGSPDSLTGSDPTAYDDGSDTLIGYGTLSGLGGNDSLSGSGNFDGGSGNDVLVGSGTLNGGQGADTVVGASGPDTLHGNDGNDTLVGLAGNDTVFGDGGNDTVFDEIFGTGGGDDTIDGGDGRDNLQGQSGNDTLTGGNEADELHGGSGQDTLYARDPIPGQFAYWMDIVDCGDDVDTAQRNTGFFTEPAPTCEIFLP